MKFFIAIFLFSLLSLSQIIVDSSEDVDQSTHQLTQPQNPMTKFQLSGYLGSNIGLHFSYAFSNRIALGLRTDRSSSGQSSASGDLDNNAYFDQKSLFSRSSVTLVGRYYSDINGQLVRNFYFQLELGRTWAKYEFDVTRYTRYNGGIDTLLFGIDKKETGKESISTNENSSLVRLWTGYHLPWKAQSLIDCVAVDLGLGIEHSALPKNHVLETSIASKEFKNLGGTQGLLEISLGGLF